MSLLPPIDIVKCQPNLAQYSVREIPTLKRALMDAGLSFKEKDEIRLSLQSNTRTVSLYLPLIVKYDCPDDSILLCEMKEKYVP